MPDEIDIDLEASDRALDRLVREHPMTDEQRAEQLRRLKELRPASAAARRPDPRRDGLAAQIQRRGLPLAEPKGPIEATPSARQNAGSSTPSAARPH